MKPKSLQSSYPFSGNSELPDEWRNILLTLMSQAGEYSSHFTA